MCAANLLLFVTLLASDIVVFGISGHYVDAVWLWGWNLGTVYLGWQLLKERFRAQRAEGGGVLKIDATYRAPVFLMMPGFVSDGIALSSLAAAYVRDQRFSRRRRASKLWVGQPAKDGVIKVQGVRVKTDDPDHT